MRKEDISFYDFSFTHLAQFKDYISLNIELNYCGCGKLEAHLSLDRKELAELLSENEFLYCRCGDVWAVVTSWSIGGDIAVFGRTPEWLLTKRCVQAFEKTNALPSAIAAYAVTSGAGDFVTAGSFSGTEIKKDYKTDAPKTVYDVVCEVLRDTGLGFRVRVDYAAKKLIFEVYSGAERLATVAASELTAYDMTYTCDRQENVNSGGWYERKMEYKGTWNPKTNTPTLSNKRAANAYTYYRITTATYTQFGIKCTEGSYLYSDTADGAWKVSEEAPKSVWVNIPQGSESGAKKWETVLSGQMTQEEAVAALAEKKTNIECEAEVRRLEYGTDYSLGDTVRVRFEFGSFRATEKRRISGVMIYADVNESGVRPTFEKPETV